MVSSVLRSARALFSVVEKKKTGPSYLPQRRLDCYSPQWPLPQPRGWPSKRGSTIVLNFIQSAIRREIEAASPSDNKKGASTPPPPKGFLLRFFLEDKTSASDIFSSCLFIPRAHFETNLLMVRFRGSER